MGKAVKVRLFNVYYAENLKSDVIFCSLLEAKGYGTFYRGHHRGIAGIHGGHAFYVETTNNVLVVRVLGYDRA